MSVIQNPIILHEYTVQKDNNRIESVVIDGYHISRMIDHLNVIRGNETTQHIIGNAKNAISYFSNPQITKSSSKILCLGKVQSGKTAFFISCISLSFDNGYNLCFLFGGTKSNLLDQNLERLQEDFSNNKYVKIVELMRTSIDEVKQLLDNGYKVIIVVLKNVSSNSSNLYTALEYAAVFHREPTLVIDDESDEHTPGAPRLRSRNIRAGITHDIIAKITEAYRIITVLFVTATPQANLLISALDELSPDYAVLVEPGNDYTGGDAFHDIESNTHVEEIDDADDFIKSIPESYKRALRYFMLGTSLMCLKNPNTPYSMLIHPSALTKVHKNIVEKISEDLTQQKEILSNPRNPVYKLMREEFYNDYLKENLGDTSFDKIFNTITQNLNKYKIYEYNTTETGKQDIESIMDDQTVKYKIFVGGNMLGRGMTIPNLTVTYMYRDSKISAIDTLYQRARWFGYKREYFDICRVYMTPTLKRKFIDVADSERDLWNSISEFLSENIDLKLFKRIFSLPNDKLILTRQSVSKTITFERIKPGYTYDKSLLFGRNDILYNLDLVSRLINSDIFNSSEVTFSKGDNQTHLKIEGKYTDLYDFFISKYAFQKNSVLGPYSFTKILEQIKNNQIDDHLVVFIMRYKTGQFRSLSKQGNSLKELPQGYDSGTGYPGDKNLTGYENVLHLQVHLVYIDKYSRESFIPILAFYNPLTRFNIRYATGDAFYDEL